MTVSSLKEGKLDPITDILNKITTGSKTLNVLYLLFFRQSYKLSYINISDSTVNNIDIACLN